MECIRSSFLLPIVNCGSLSFRISKESSGSKRPLPDSICAKISELRRGSSIGDSPGYFAPLIPDLAIRGFPELLVMAQFEPLSRALVQRVSVGITELDLNMLVVGFDRPGTDPQFFRDPVCSKAGTNQPKDMQLAVGQVTGVAICGRTF